MFLTKLANGKCSTVVTLLLSVMGIKCVELKVLSMNRFHSKMFTMLYNITISQWGQSQFQMEKKEMEVLH